MKMSCNGCRILRKGCHDNCILKPCLEWIHNPHSQSNATLFLAKFYGRAGLLNLINAAPPHLHPAIFRSLLYDACGRIMNPIYGSVGLMWSGNWDHCQAAVDSVLNGSAIMQLPFDNDDHDGAAPHPIMPLEGGDIRHISTQQVGVGRVRTRNRSRGSSSGVKVESDYGGESDWNTSQTLDSVSVETVEGSLGNKMEWEPKSEIVLELTLACIKSNGGDAPPF